MKSRRLLKIFSTSQTAPLQNSPTASAARQSGKEWKERKSSVLTRALSILSFLFTLWFFIFCVQFAYSAAGSNSPAVGMFNVYFSLDEAIGYRDVRDDLSEVYAAGFSLVTHYFRSENSREPNGQRFWAGLDRWLRRNPQQADRLRDWKRTYGESLGWMLFFWSTYIQEAYTQTNGGLKVIIGEMYAAFGAREDWDGLKTFVKAISEYESDHYPNTIAGWYIAEEPNSLTKRYKPEIANQVIEYIKLAESAYLIKHRDIYIDVSASQSRKKVAPFLKNVDVIMLSPDAYIWAKNPPTYVEEAQYERIHHAVRMIREYTDSEVRIHVVLQAYDWNKSGPLQPNHINMHQQVRYALQPGLVNRGKYGNRPKWVDPPDGLWFWWWHDCKSKKRAGDGRIISDINRWDEGTEGHWAEAIKTELQNRENAVLIRGSENWSGTIHIIGDVIIAEDAVLTIEPGAKVKFSVFDHFRGGQDTKRCELIVRGKLVARGNEKRWITFESDSKNRKQLPHPRKPKADDWYGIRKEGKKAKVELEYLQINHARFTSTK